MKRPPGPIIVALLIWDTAWKGAAIYRAVRLRQWAWIAPLATVSTAGALPIVYLKFIAARGSEEG